MRALRGRGRFLEKKYDIIKKVNFSSRKVKKSKEKLSDIDSLGPKEHFYEKKIQEK